MTLNVSNHNGTLLADHFLDPESIPRVLYLTHQFLIDIKVLVTIFYKFTGGQDGYTHTSRHTQLIYWLNML